MFSTEPRRDVSPDTLAANVEVIRFVVMLNELGSVQDSRMPSTDRRGVPPGARLLSMKKEGGVMRCVSTDRAELRRGPLDRLSFLLSASRTSNEVKVSMLLSSVFRVSSMGVVRASTMDSTCRSAGLLSMSRLAAVERVFFPPKA